MDAAIRKAKDSFGQIFDKNLHDLVRGIRNHKEHEAKYIAECIDEIKQELKQDNIAVKANAINKLCYLQMIGYDISWASFNIIEVMSSTKFTFKRIGYLAASQTFHEGTDVLMLTTNLIRKDLGSQSMYECGVAISGLACFLTPDLARDLVNEIMNLMTSNKPYIRKKAVLIMYKIFLKYPDALRPSFPRLKEKLDDPEPSVQAAAVNVICELARKNPKNYLSLAPIFFKLMSVSTNNWVLIKIIKLFGALTPLEPRLGKKLIEPLTNIINSTSAMSLLYECINTVLAVLVSISSGQPNHNSAIEVCLQKLRILIEDSDQNLKYLGLLAMSKILQTNPKSVQMHKDLIMQCLDDKDESIRLRSLDLLYGMVSKKNLMEIIKKLMMHMSKAEGTHYRDELLAKIIDICSQNNYQFVTNFEWYVSVLVELTRMEGTRHGKLLSSQMLDVAIRVETIRPFIVAQMSILIDNMHVFAITNSIPSKENKNYSDICEVLNAATWICGEFAANLQNPMKTLESMSKSKVTNLPGHIQSTFVQNIFKLYVHLIKKNSQDYDECKRLTDYLIDKMKIFEQNSDIEVQERACSFLQILKYVLKMLDSDPSGVENELWSLFEGELNPVAPKAQRKVPVPEGLDLDAWINDPPSDEEQNDLTSSQENHIFVKNEKFELKSYTSYGGNNSSDIKTSVSVGAKKIQPDISEEDLAKYKESRKIQIESNPFYIKQMKKSESNSLMSNNMSKATSYSESIRSQSIDLKIPISIPGVTSSDSYYRMSKIDDENKKLKKKMKSKAGKDSKKKKSKNDVEEDDEDEENIPVVKILANEMPDGVNNDSDDDKNKFKDPKDPHRALDIDLDEPLKDYERLPTSGYRPGILTDKPKKTNGLKEEPKKESNHKKEEKKKSKSKSKDAEKSEKKSRHKKSDKSVDLLVSNDTVNGHENEYNELLSPEHEIKTVITESKIKKQDQGDDLEFWLSGTKSEEKEEVKIEEKIEPKVEKKSKKSKKDETKDEKKKEKKSKSKGKNGHHDLKQAEIEDSKNIYKHVASNKHLNISCLMRPNHMNLNQLIIGLRLDNITTDDKLKNSEISSIELNLLNTSSLKLIREDKKSANDSIRIPFSLSNSSQNEIEYFFEVSDCTYGQILKGNFIYIIKSDLGTIQDKIDFKLKIPCSSFLIPTSCDNDEFSKWLSSGQLTSKYSIKCNISNYEDINSILGILTSNFHLTKIEIVDNTASIFASTMKHQPICILIKLLGNETLSMDGKSTSQSLIENILDELKTVISV
ncbi:unnamed protein product [Brachionus calyciflorus]|uniref:AP-3 complex subunit delta n=1 Tax=Brachionus calyciflorus TaxID=104777 RepID=A0A813NHX7_9BILA|nr:unnamed protein product [Brachionus calyciflorus]